MWQGLILKLDPKLNSIPGITVQKYCQSTLKFLRGTLKFVHTIGTPPRGKPMMLINSQHFVATLTSHSPGHVTPRYRNPLQLQGSNDIFSPKKVVGLCDKLRSQNPPKNEKTYPTKREVGKIIVPRRVYLEIDFYFDPWWRFKPVACSTSLVLGSRLHRNEFCHEVYLSRVHVSRVPCP